MQFPIQLRARQRNGGIMLWLSPLAALGLTVLAGAILFACLGQDPVRALQVFLLAPLESVRGWAEVGVKMTPLLLCACGLVICFRANVWNIGAEGQFLTGAILGGWVALHCPAWLGFWSIPCVLAAGVAGGALWAGVTALLRDRFHANEILVSLMLVYVAQFALAYCVQGPMQDPEGLGFPQSPLFETYTLLPILVSGTRLHVGFALAVLAAVVMELVLSRTFIGFQFKVSGIAPLAAKYAGYGTRRLLWISLLLSGALAGLAGICEVTGPVGQLTLTISPGYGFAAIIVAFVGRLSPAGCIPAAFVMALFYLGGELGQSRLGLPSSITGVYQGMLLFFLLICDTWIAFEPVWVGFGTGKKEAK